MEVVAVAVVVAVLHATVYMAVWQTPASNDLFVCNFHWSPRAERQ